MEPGVNFALVRDFAIALLIGALAGIEREKRKASDARGTIGGVRTFILIALFGATSAWLSKTQEVPWIFVGALAAVSVMVVVGYFLGVRNRGDSVGLTTEMAALAVFVLAGMVLFGYRDLAVGLGIITAATLAYKQPLHGFVERIGWDDLLAGLRLLIASFIVLPLLPRETVDPWGAINPHKLWLLVILISTLSFAGYVATRLLGEGRGIPLTGLTGGLVSSTAVTLSLARRSKDAGAGTAVGAISAGILLAWGVMFVRVLVEVLLVEPRLATRLIGPFLVLAGTAAGLAWWMVAGRGASKKSETPVPLRNPFSLTEAAKFAALFAAVLLVVKLTQQFFPAKGLYPVAALAGLTDVDAITLSMAGYAGETGDDSTAAKAITIAALTNTFVKCGMVAFLGAPGLRSRAFLATALLCGVAVLSFLVF